MVTFGLDISHHQAASLDLAQCRREGVGFIFIKSSEGSSFIDPAFAGNLNKARAAGLLVAAYHYVRSNATAAAQVANVARVVPRDVPVIPDVEANSGGIALVRDFVARLRQAGYHVPLTYLPGWYWQQIGSPSLVGLPSLWSSRYPDNVVGSIADEYADVPASYWNGYGGLGVAVLQFTSSARVAGHQPLDANVYQGTFEQLAALLGGEEDDMAGEGPNILAAVMTGGDSTRGITLGINGEVVYPRGVDPTSLLGRTADVQFALTKFLPILLEAAQREPIDIATYKVIISNAVHAAVDAALPESLSDEVDASAIAEAVKHNLALALVGSNER
jgi:hypothetical protein